MYNNVWHRTESENNPVTFSTEMKERWITHLLKFEDMLIEVILQMLIGIVDAELLKTVAAKVFKTKDIQHPNGVPFMLRVMFLCQQGLVNLQYNPVKQRSIYTFGHSITSSYCLEMSTYISSLLFFFAFEMGTCVYKKTFNHVLVLHHI